MYVTLCICHSVFIHRMTNSKYHIDIVISPDDRHIVTRNM